MDSQEMLKPKRKFCPCVCCLYGGKNMTDRAGAKERPKTYTHATRDLPSAMFPPQSCQEVLLLTPIRIQIPLLSLSALLKLKGRHHSKCPLKTLVSMGIPGWTTVFSNSTFISNSGNLDRHWRAVSCNYCIRCPFSPRDVHSSNLNMKHPSGISSLTSRPVQKELVSFSHRYVGYQGVGGSAVGVLCKEVGQTSSFILGVHNHKGAPGS